MQSCVRCVYFFMQRLSMEGDDNDNDGVRANTMEVNTSESKRLWLVNISPEMSRNRVDRIVGGG